VRQRGRQLGVRGRRERAAPAALVGEDVGHLRAAAAAAPPPARRPPGRAARAGARLQVARHDLEVQLLLALLVLDRAAQAAAQAAQVRRVEVVHVLGHRAARAHVLAWRAAAAPGARAGARRGGARGAARARRAPPEGGSPDAAAMAVIWSMNRRMGSRRLNVPDTASTSASVFASSLPHRAHCF